jgi:hypothetical protein
MMGKGLPRRKVGVAGRAERDVRLLANDHVEVRKTRSWWAEPR